MSFTSMKNSLRSVAQAVLVAAVFALIPGQAHAAAVALPANALSWFKAENNANDSAGSNNGTVSSVSYAAGMVGQAFSFNGTSDYFTVPAAAIPIGNNPITVEMWLYTQSSSWVDNENTVFEYQGGSNGTFALDIMSFPNLQFYSFGANDYVFNTGLSSDTGWFHLAITHDGTTMKFYINGSQVDSVTRTLATGSGGVLNIGRSGYLDYYFDGKLDEFTTYSRALSAAEVLSIYNAGSAGKVAPEVNVTGNSVSIASGDVSPSTGDFTDFGTAAVSGGTVVRAFVIQNTGTSTLNISSITSNNGQFVVSGAPSTVAASSSATFYVTFDPSGTGAQSATITINNNDADEGTYTFSVAGTGAATAAQAYDANSGGGNGTGNGTADTLRVRLNGSNIEFSANNFSTITSIPSASVTSLTLTGSSDDDTFVIDFSGGNPIPSGGITVNGGSQVTGDKLRVTGGIFGTVTHNLVNANDGSVVIASNGTINYTGLEPVDMTGSTVADLVFNLPAGGSNAILEDDGTPANTFSTFREAASGFELTTFANPSGSLTINRGNAGDTLTINATPDFTASLTVGTTGSRFGSVTVAGALSLASGKNLTVFSTGTVNFTTSSSDVALLGTGAASITSSRDIAFASGSSLTTVNGNLTLSANAAGAGTGNFAGINNSGLIQASGTGVVTLTGRGGDTGTFQVGIFVQAGGDIIGGTTGTMVLTGTGGPSSANGNHGISVEGSGSSITSGGANVSLIGVGNGTGAASEFNFGVEMSSAGLISAGGSGSVTVNGTGSSNAANSIYGVVMNTGGTITSSGGNVSVTGTGGQSGAGLVSGGVWVDASTITAGGSGSVTVVGSAEQTVTALSKIGVDVRFTGQITSSGGNVQVTGTGGPYTSSVNYEGSGVRLIGDGLITAGGTGTVTVTGTGGAGSTVAGVGVAVDGLGLSSNLARIGAANGTTTITAIAGNTSSPALVVGSSTAGRVTTGNNNAIVFNIDSASIGSAGIISSGTGSTTINARTASTLVDLGGADVLTSGPFTLGLTDAELDTITAGTLFILPVNGAVTVSAAITHANNLTVTGAAAITVNNAITMAVDKSLTVSTTSTASGIVLATSSSDVAASGTGAISLTATRNIGFASGSSLTTVNGNLTLSANSAGTTTGSFSGIDINGATVQSTGTGVVSVTGKAGDAAGGGQTGITVNNAGTLSGGTSGTMTVAGTGGPSTGNSNFGVHVGSALITSAGANVQITGQGGGTGGASTANIGVFAINSGVITAGGSGTVTVQGTGGSGTGGSGVGVAVSSISSAGSAITSNGGNVSVTGSGGGSGTAANNLGVAVADGGVVSAGGSGTVTVQGTGGVGSGAGNIGVSVAGNSVANGRITSSGGAVQVTGIEGSGASGVAINVGGTQAHAITTATSGGTVTLIGNSISIGANGTVSAQNASSVTIRPNTSTVAINLGTATDTIGGPLGLSDAELDQISAGTINIGNNSSGAITVSAAITHLNANAINLDSGTAAVINIAAAAGITTSGGAVTFTDAVSLNSAGTVTVDTTNAGGTAAGANITFSGTINGSVANTTSLTVNAGTGGTLTLTGAVGTTTTLANFTATSGTSLTLPAVTTGGALSVTVNTLNNVLTVSSATAVGGTTTFVADNMALNVNVTGTTSVTLRQSTAGTLINLGGADAPGTLGLTDAELDRFTAATTLSIGNTSSGAVAISASITRTPVTAITVTTASGNAIAFGAAGVLNANGGNVSLVTSGAGAITSGSATSDILGATVSLSAGSGGIGTTGNPIAISSTTVSASTASNADINLTEADTTTLGTVNAGTGTISLVSGTFYVASGGTSVINGNLDVYGTLDQQGQGRNITSGTAGNTVRVRSTGTVVIYANGATPYATMFNAGTITSRKPPTLDAGSTVTWQSPSAATMDLTSFQNVNVNGRGTISLSANTSVAGTMTVNYGARLDTGGFIVNGAGTFTLATGGALGVGSVDGITTGGSTGSIQTGTRNYSGAASYIYNGSALQVTGNGLPTTITAPAPSLPAGQKLWLQGEGNASDASGTGNNGTTVGTLTYATAQVNQGFNTAGVGSVIVSGNPASLQLSSGSVGAWIRTTDTGTSYTGILVKNGAYGLLLRNGALWLFDWGGSFGGVGINTGVSVADGNFHHVALTFQAGVVNGTVVYVDGVPVYTGSYSASGQGNNFAVGSGNGNGIGQLFNGVIDEVMIFDSVLSPAQVQSLMSGFLPANIVVNNASGVQLTSTTAVDTLTLSAGILDARVNSRVLTVGSHTGASTSSYVLGDVRHVFTASLNQSFSYPVGDTGYSPVLLSDVDATGAGGITVTANDVIHPNIVVGGTEIAGLNDTKTLKRYWTLSKDTFVGTFDPQLTYVDPTDLPSGLNESLLVMRRYNDDGFGIQWYDVNAASLTRSAVNNTVQSDGASGMGDYTLGEQAIGYYDISISGGGIGILQNTAANLVVAPKDYVGVNVLSPHESVDLTFYASPAATFQFDSNGNTTFGEAGDNLKLSHTSGSFLLSVKDPTAETVDVYVQDQLGRFGYKSVLVGHAPTAVSSGGSVVFNGSGRYGYTPNLASQWPAAGATGHEDVTVELWFNGDATGGVLFDERGAADTKGFRASWIELVPVAGQLEVRIRVWNLPAAPTTGLTLGTVAPGTWHHVALRYNETGTGLLEGFLDGVKAAPQAIGDRVTPMESTEGKGIYYGLGLADTTHLGSGAAFSGKMDEVRIWNVARSDAQITNNWNKPIDPASANLVAYYQFEDGTGTTADDSSANGLQVSFHGTPPTWSVSGAMTAPSALVYEVQVGSTLVLALNGYDPDHTGVLTASKTGNVTGSGATLTQYDNSAISGSGTVLVTDSDRRVKVTGTGAGTIQFNYLVNNGIADSGTLQITVNVVAANGAPVIGTTSPVVAGTEDVVVSLPYATLVSTFNATDGGTFDFRIPAVVNGSLRKNGTMVVNYPLTVAAGDTLEWIPPINTNGVITAFTARTYDGVQYRRQPERCRSTWRR